MLKKFKSRTAVLFGIAAIACAALFIGAAGCGQSDDEQSASRVIVRNPTRTPATPPQPTSQATTIAQLTTEADLTQDACEESIAVATSQPVTEVTYDTAEAAYHDRRYDEAVDLFTAYTSRKSDNPWGFYMLGLSAWKAGDLDRAVAALEQAAQLDPKHVKSRVNVARVLLDQGHATKANVWLDQVIELDGESRDVYRLKGRVFHQLKQYDIAIEKYQRAIVIDDTDVWSMNNLGLLYMERGRHSEALPPLARAVEVAPNNATFWNNLGMALEHSGHFRGAEDAYESATIANALFEKAASNFDRVSAVREEVDVPPVDLALLAQGFVDEIALLAQDASEPQTEFKEPEEVVIRETVQETAEPVQSSDGEFDGDGVPEDKEE